MALRLDTVQQFDPGSPEPVGTLQEVRAMGLSPLKYGSCSMPAKNNIGCKHYDDPAHGPCPILQLCRAKNRKGYERVAFVRILNPTVMKQDACMCHQFMATLAHADPRNGVTHVLGLGGEVTIKRRGSVALDPNNPKSKSKSVLSVEKIEPALRPHEAMADRAATIQLARDMNLKSAQAAAHGMTALANSTVNDDTVEAEESLDDGFDGEPEVDGEPSGGLSTDEPMPEPEFDSLMASDELDGDEDSVLSDDEPQEPAEVAAVSGGRRRGRPPRRG